MPWSRASLSRLPMHHATLQMLIARHIRPTCPCPVDSQLVKSKHGEYDWNSFADAMQTKLESEGVKNVRRTKMAIQGRLDTVRAYWMWRVLEVCILLCLSRQYRADLPPRSDRPAATLSKFSDKAKFRSTAASPVSARYVSVYCSTPIPKTF